MQKSFGAAHALIDGAIKLEKSKAVREFLTGSGEPISLVVKTLDFRRCHGSHVGPDLGDRKPAQRSKISSLSAAPPAEIFFRYALARITTWIGRIVYASSFLCQHMLQGRLKNGLHRNQIDLLIRILKAFWAERQDFYVSGNLTVYYSP
ncbi:MAG: hypothetical protein AAGF32_00435, partial [Pseudomonadota bacterium]